MLMAHQIMEITFLHRQETQGLQIEKHLQEEVCYEQAIQVSLN